LLSGGSGRYATQIIPSARLRPSFFDVGPKPGEQRAESCDFFKSAPPASTVRALHSAICRAQPKWLQISGTSSLQWRPFVGCAVAGFAATSSLIEPDLFGNIAFGVGHQNNDAVFEAAEILGIPLPFRGCCNAEMSVTVIAVALNSGRVIASG